MSARKSGYFNEKNYYSFDIYEGKVIVMSECCFDGLDYEGALELYHLLGDWLIGTRVTLED